MSLFVQNKQQWLDTIDSWDEGTVTAKEKLLARHLQDVIDLFGEWAKEDTDFWGNHVRVSVGMLYRRTGMHRSTIWRILFRWNDAGLISKKTDHYVEQGEFKSRMYLEVSERFLNGDIRIGRKENEKTRFKEGNKKSREDQGNRCEGCGQYMKKFVTYRCPNGCTTISGYEERNKKHG